MVYEFRTYTALEGRLEALNARFRNHTLRLFEKHGMKNIGYWIPQDAPFRENTLVYVVAHESREAAQRAWDAFRADAEWHKVRADSEADGPIVAKVESMFLDSVNYSPLR